MKGLGSLQNYNSAGNLFKNCARLNSGLVPVPGQIDKNYKGSGLFNLNLQTGPGMSTVKSHRNLTDMFCDISAKVIKSY